MSITEFKETSLEKYLFYSTYANCAIKFSTVSKALKICRKVQNKLTARKIDEYCSGYGQYFTNIGQIPPTL